MQNFRGSSYLLTLVGIVVWCFSAIWQPAPPPKYSGLGPIKNRIPAEVDGYARGDERVQPEVVLKALAAADIVSFPYQSAKGWFDLTLIGGTDRSALHDPRSCLVGSGWKLSGDREEVIPGTNVPFRRALATNDSEPNDFEFLYVYVVGTKTINQVTQIRAQMLAATLIGRRNTPVCFVRFQRPVAKGQPDDPEEAQRFRNFAAKIWNELEVPANL